MLCKLMTEADAARTGSMELCGFQARPSFPLITALKKPEPARKGPGREPITEVGRVWAT